MTFLQKNKAASMFPIAMMIVCFSSFPKNNPKSNHFPITCFSTQIITSFVMHFQEQFYLLPSIILKSILFVPISKM